MKVWSAASIAAIWWSVRHQTVQVSSRPRLPGMAVTLIDAGGPDPSGTHTDTAALTPFVGCAGWGQISGAPQFSALEGSQLERYASVFNAVEINSSFYRSHRQTTYANWAASVPPAFRFSVKLLRTITHASRLMRIDALLAQFRQETAGLGDKLGCVLVQLPPSLELDAMVADAFFTKLRSHFPCMLACEARHASWFGDEATALLAQHTVTRVLADPPKGQTGAHLATTMSSYRRLHGVPRMYYSSYTEAYLAQLADDLMAELSRPPHGNGPAWAIFDNTASGAALGNALTVVDACAQESTV